MGFLQNLEKASQYRLRTEREYLVHVFDRSKNSNEKMEITVSPFGFRFQALLRSTTFPRRRQENPFKSSSEILLTGQSGCFYLKKSKPCSRKQFLIISVFENNLHVFRTSTDYTCYTYRRTVLLIIPIDPWLYVFIVVQISSMYLWHSFIFAKDSMKLKWCNRYCQQHICWRLFQKKFLFYRPLDARKLPQ